MKEIVSRVLTFFSEVTGRKEIGFKESWEYVSPAPGDPYTAVVYGSTRFEQAHVAIILPDGSRFVQYLKSLKSALPIEQQTWHMPKGRVYQVRWPGGEVLPPEKRST